MTFSGIVFDCDGVLFESRAANLAYYNRVLEHFGVESVTVEDRERAHLCHTAASPQVFATLLGAERAQLALSMAAKLDYRDFIPRMTPEPGLIEALHLLSARYPLAIATNRGASMHEILCHFGMERYFSAVVTSRDVPRPKPYPDMLLLAASRLGKAPDELLFVGDSELDAQAAGAAGMPFMAYGTRELGAKAQVNSHAQLLRWCEEKVS